MPFGHQRPPRKTTRFPTKHFSNPVSSLRLSKPTKLNQLLDNGPKLQFDCVLAARTSTARRRRHHNRNGSSRQHQELASRPRSPVLLLGVGCVSFFLFCISMTGRLERIANDKTKATFTLRQHNVHFGFALTQYQYLF